MIKEYVNEAVLSISDSYSMVVSGLHMTRDTMDDLDQLLDTQKKIEIRTSDITKRIQNFEDYGMIIKNSMTILSSENEYNHENISLTANSIEELLLSFTEIMNKIKNLESESKVLVQDYYLDV